MFNKKVFPFFWAISCAFAYKVYKNANRSKKIVSSKIQLWLSKNAEFHADFKSVEKVLQKCTEKKLLAKMWWKYALFPLLLMFIKLVLFIPFLVHFFKTFSTDMKSAWNYAFFDTFCLNFFLYVILVLFSNFAAKTRKKGAKNQEHVLSKYFLDLNFAPIIGCVFLIF
jgi:hypothetical protein